jgi:uncharacterized protein YjbJ (UPF0337 family)
VSKVNTDVFESTWDQIRSQVKQRWDKLTDDDLSKVRGGVDGLVDLLQEKYGYGRDRAERKVDRSVSKIDNGQHQSATKMSEVAEALRERAAGAPEKARETTDALRQSAAEVPTTARQTAKENPWAMVLVVLCLILLLGLFIRRRNN